MRVLWLEGYRNNGKNTSTYNGVGWIKSLRDAMIQDEDIDLAEAFFDFKKRDFWLDEKIKQFPIFLKKRNVLQKLYYNWYGYKNDSIGFIRQVLGVIDDFKPDIIQVFGTESPFSYIQDYTDIPVLIYIQGLLNPIHNTYFPANFDKYSFLIKRFSLNELVLHNGYIFNGSKMAVNAMRELHFLKNAKYIIGRTSWDHKMIQLLSPNAKYFTLDEIMRPDFYTDVHWSKKRVGKLIIYSTISDVPYKGLDVILKTAKILSQQTNVDFSWHIAGLTSECKLVKLFEKCFSIISSDVNVYYDGVVSPENLVEKLLNSDVYVHPSYIENSSNGICEAQLLGVPVVACNVGGISSLVKNEQTGILLPANSPYELAYVLSSVYETDNLRRYVEEAKRIAEDRHNKRQVCDTLFSIYECVLSF